MNNLPVLRSIKEHFLSGFYLDRKALVLNVLFELEETDAIVTVFVHGEEQALNDLGRDL